MRHVEAVIRTFDPAYDAHRIAAKRRQRLRGSSAGPCSGTP
jgi:hypothetical protein